MKWRGIIEVNVAVDATDEQDAKEKIAASVTTDDVVTWCEEA